MTDIYIQPEITEAKDKFLELLSGETNRGRHDIEVFAGWAIEKMPQAMQDKLAPAKPNPDLVKQARALISGFLPALKSIDGPDPRQHPLWPLEEGYRDLSGTLRLMNFEKQTIGACLQDFVHNSDEFLDFEEIAEEFHELMVHRYNETNTLSQDERIIRDGNRMISKGLKMVKDPELLEPIKRAAGEFRQFVNDLKVPENEDALAR